MGWFQARKEEKQKRELYARINGKHLAYATERMPDGREEVIGKDGSVAVTETEIFLRVGETYAFHGRLDEVKLGELMSRNGITVQGFDIAEGRVKSVVGYYQYHRK